MTTIRLLLKWLRAELRAERLSGQAQRSLRHDRSHVSPGRACACCRGTGTVLRLEKQTSLYVCKDRALCREIMIMTSLLQSSA